jgi:hypothetical protein
MRWREIWKERSKSTMAAGEEVLSCVRRYDATARSFLAGQPNPCTDGYSPPQRLFEL